jgi:hypothetical protein
MCVENQTEDLRASASNQCRLAVILRSRGLVYFSAPESRVPHATAGRSGLCRRVSDLALSVLSYDESTSELTAIVPSRNLFE